HLVEPAPTLIVEIRVADELPAIDKIPPHVADRPLHFAFGLRAIRAAGANAKAQVVAEAEELRMLQEFASLRARIVEDHRLQLIEQQLLRHTAEISEGLLEPRDEGPERLARIELEPEEPREREDHDECVALPPGKAKLRKVDLRLMARRGLEAHHGLGLR